MVPPGGGGRPSRHQFSSEAGRAGLHVLVEISLATVRDPDVAAESQAAAAQAASQISLLSGPNVVSGQCIGSGEPKKSMVALWSLRHLGPIQF